MNLEHMTNNVNRGLTAPTESTIKIVHINKRNNLMTYEETKEIVSEIQEVEAWSRNLVRAYASDDQDWEEIQRMEKWLAEAKEKLFARCTTTRASLVS